MSSAPYVRPVDERAGDGVESTPAIPARNDDRERRLLACVGRLVRVVPQLLEHRDGLDEDEHRPRPPEALRDGRWRVRFHSA